MLRPGAVERKVSVVAVNHGFRSEPKTVKIHVPE
jgi:hypothetical protein